MASGKISAVITTRNSDSPSTPTCHETPSPSIQVYWSQNWKAWAMSVSNTASIHTTSAAGTQEASSATSLNRSGRDRGKTSSIKAPAAGASTSTVRTAANDGCE